MLTTKDIYQLAKDQSFRCALTGEPLTPETATLDHKTSRANSGNDEVENMQVVHTLINRMKHTLGNDEFVEWCRRVVQHADANAVSR